MEEVVFYSRHGQSWIRRHIDCREFDPVAVFLETLTSDNYDNVITFPVLLGYLVIAAVSFLASDTDRVTPFQLDHLSSF